MQELNFYESEYVADDEEPRAYPLQTDINDYFTHVGIGWRLDGGRMIARGDDAFERTVGFAEEELRAGGRTTAAGRIRRAIEALSIRPSPDLSGAVSHAISAMECVLHDITGKPQSLSEYLKRHQALFPDTLSKAVDGLWNYANKGARHGREGVEPTREEAEFVVATSAAVTTYLNGKHPRP